MSKERPVASLRYYGVSPWEVEVLYALLNGLFRVEEKQETNQDENFPTMIDIVFPFAFNDAFFKWFGNARWDKLKGVLKELKRRRGGGNSLKVAMSFVGNPNIKFIVGRNDNNKFNTAIEKIDFVLELLQYQLDPQKIPQSITNVVYEFDDTTGRWNLSTAFSNKETFIFSQNQWKSI